MKKNGMETCLFCGPFLPGGRGRRNCPSGSPWQQAHEHPTQASLGNKHTNTDSNLLTVQACTVNQGKQGFRGPPVSTYAVGSRFRVYRSAALRQPFLNPRSFSDSAARGAAFGLPTCRSGALGLQGLKKGEGRARGAPPPPFPPFANTMLISRV